jgi:hypothetical protein
MSIFFLPGRTDLNHIFLHKYTLHKRYKSQLKTFAVEVASFQIESHSSLASARTRAALSCPALRLLWKAQCTCAFWRDFFQLDSIHLHTGRSLSEALVFASTNPQYDDRFFIELQVQYMKIPSSNLGRTCCIQKLFLTFRTNIYTTCSPYVLGKEELLTKIYLYLCSPNCLGPFLFQNQCLLTSQFAFWRDFFSEFLSSQIEAHFLTISWFVGCFQRNILTNSCNGMKNWN